MTDAHGYYALSYWMSEGQEANVSAPGFVEQKQRLSSEQQELDVILVKEHKDWKFRVLEWNLRTRY